MNTNNRIDLLDRRLELYSSLIFKEDSLIFSTDLEVTSVCEVDIVFNDSKDIQSRLSRRDFIFIGKYNLFGIIVDFTIDSDNSAKIKFQIGNDILNHDTLLQTQVKIDAGAFIEAKLTSEFINTTFSQSKLPLTIQNKSNKLATIFSPDGVLEFSKLWRQLKRTSAINIKTEILGGTNNTIHVTISDFEQITHIVAEDDREILNCDIKFSGDQTTRFTLVDNLNNSFIFYLQKDGSITTNENSENLVTSFLDKKKFYNEVLTIDKARAEASNEMTGKYENNIELKVEKELFDKISLGDKVSFVLKNRNVVPTVASAKKQNGGTDFFITLGTSRRRFTDLLKKGSV